MSNPSPDLSSRPAMPLSYYGEQGAAWAGVVRFMSWVAVSYASLVVFAAFAWLVLWVHDGATVLRLIHSSSGSVEDLLYGFVLLLPLIAKASLGYGGVLTLRLRTRGRVWIIRSAFAVCVCELLSFIVNLLSDVHHRASFMNGQFFVAMAVNGVFTMLQSDFLPVMLWIFFRRREVREVFDRA
jgi:hypothetical protein